MKKRITKHWYNNGIVELMIAENETVPNDWVKGRLPESMLKTSTSKIGTHLSVETKQKLRKANLGKKLSAITKQKIGLASIGRQKTEAGRQRISQAKKGSHHTAEAKAKISTAATGKKHPHKGVPKKRESIIKMNETKRRNHTFNTSTSEKYFNDFLIELIGKDNFKIQYTDNRYPFNCDFYIPKFDLFIELNHHWTHGKHVYNKENIEDTERLKVLEEKASTSKFYKTAIYVWTKLDLRKQQIAKENNLNYLVSYNKEDMYKIMEHIKQLIKERYIV